MLLRYIVSNYKSIGQAIEFSMLPASENVDDRYINTIQTRSGEWKVLRRGCFYGPNASGKSAFVESLAFVQKMIVSGIRSGKSIPIDQFRGYLDDSSHLSTFQLVFYAEGEVYEYGFSMNRVLVAEEWLYKLQKNGFKPMFTRTTDAKKKTSIEIDTALARKDSKERKLAELLKQTIQEEQCNQLFLYKLYDNGVKAVWPVMNWFKKLHPIFPITKIAGLPMRVDSDKAFGEFLQTNLSQMDTGVVSLEVKKDVIDFNEYAEKMGLPEVMIEDILSHKEGIVQIQGKYFMFFDKDEKPGSRAILQHCVFIHELNGKKVSFEIEDESDGTQRLTDLLPILFQNDKKNGDVYIVDEIDRSLHTKLSSYLLESFLKTEKTAQLIFTAHDVNLISMKRFCQDEIWFIEKRNTGETTIRPMSDFQVQEGQDALKAYLNGRFGAIPRIGGEV